jgi:hypothetical protein
MKPLIAGHRLSATLISGSFLSPVPPALRIWRTTGLDEAAAALEVEIASEPG